MIYLYEIFGIYGILGYEIKKLNTIWAIIEKKCWAQVFARFVHGFYDVVGPVELQFSKPCGYPLCQCTTHP